MRDVAREK
jgi:integrase